VSRDCADQPGGLAQGPEEKKGRAGSALGRVTKITLLAESSRRVGTAWPDAGSNGWTRDGNGGRERFACCTAQEFEFAGIGLETIAPIRFTAGV